MSLLKNVLQQVYPVDQYNVIVANGKFPEDPYLQQLILEATTIICCDGAISQLLKHNITPDCIIGDCDSLSDTLRRQFSDKIIVIPEQNTNDLTKAVNHAVKLNLDNIVILGATGLREDHTLGNISLLIEYKKQIKNIAMISDYGIFTVASGSSEQITIPGQQISFFATNRNTTLSCKELKWPLDNQQFTSWHAGTLNQAIRNKINLISNVEIIVYRAFEVK